MEKEYQNLNELLEEGLNVDRLVAVRACFDGKLNRQGETIFAGPYSPTIHFSLNHLVGNHMYGSWDEANSVILAPMKDLVENNRGNLYGGTTTDLFLVGYANTPNLKIVSKNGESDAEFREKVDRAIEDMGYKVLPSGNWAWADSWEVTRQFSDLLKREGYEFGPHFHTAFGDADNQTFSGQSKEEIEGNGKAVRESWTKNFREFCQREKSYSGLPERFAPHIERWQNYWDGVEGDGK